MMAMRWSCRLMGLASMVVVARLLTPTDFGIIAVASALIGLLDAFTDIGADISVIRHPDPQRRHYDTAWTFSIILHSTTALIIALGAPLAADIYDDPRYESVLQVLALSMLVSGFINIGTANFRRNLQFSRDFQYNVLVQATGVLTTLGLAILLRSYWALALGGLARSVATVALSFALEGYRPRLSLAARRELFSFSFWIMMRSVARFLGGNGDLLVLGAFFAPAITAWYAIANTLANMAVFELLNPIARALLPGLAAMQGNEQWNRLNLQKVFGGTATVAAAAGVGLSALATPAVTLFYGEQFANAGPLLSTLALAAAISGFNQPAGEFLTVLGRARELAVILFLEALAAIGAAYLLASGGAGIQAVAYARLAVATLALMRLVYLLRSLRVINLLDVAMAWLRPVLAGLLMYVALWSWQQSVSLSAAMAILLGIPLGAFVYTATLLALWHLMKQPPGVEGALLQRLMARVAGWR